MTFIVSDFLVQGYVNRLKTVSKKHELIGVLLSDQGDFALPEQGIVSFSCFETGKRILIDASDHRTRQRYQEQSRRRYENILAKINAAKVDVIEINTQDSVSDILTRYFRLREKRIR